MGTQTGLACRTGPAQQLPPITTHTASCREAAVWMAAGCPASAGRVAGTVAAPHLQERPVCHSHVREQCPLAGVGVGGRGGGAEKVSHLRRFGLPGGDAGPVKQPLWRVRAPVSSKLPIPPTRQKPRVWREQTPARGALCTFQVCSWKDRPQTPRGGRTQRRGSTVRTQHLRLGRCPSRKGCQPCPKSWLSKCPQPLPPLCPWRRLQATPDLLKQTNKENPPCLGCLLAPKSTRKPSPASGRGRAVSRPTSVLGLNQSRQGQPPLSHTPLTARHCNLGGSRHGRLGLRRKWGSFWESGDTFICREAGDRGLDRDPVPEHPDCLRAGWP